MKETISSTGTLISWYVSFENSKNKEMAEIYPEYGQFLFNLNNRTFDLEEAKKIIVDEVTKKATEEQQYVIAQLKKTAHRCNKS